MKFDLRTHTMNDLLWHKKLCYGIIGCLAFSNAILSVAVFNRSEKWVLIPQYNTSHRVIVTSDGYSDEYIIDFADNALRHLMTVNPNTVDRQAKLFSEFAHDTRDVNVFLKNHQQFIKDNDAMSAFYPKDFKVLRDQNKILITGDLHYRFGDKKEIVPSTKTFEMTYHQGPQGLLLVQGLKEVPCV